jgi:hypothetical protein
MQSSPLADELIAIRAEIARLHLRASEIEAEAERAGLPLVPARRPGWPIRRLDQGMHRAA